MFRLFIALFLLSANSFAQENSSISFSEENHDFGTINETDGAVSFDFIFTNNSEEPLIVLAVKPSCGCTTPSWTKDPILPGETGVITAQFNPRNRPGVFRKSLTVTFNSYEGIMRLYINGKVIPRTKTIEELFPRKIGAIRFPSNSVNMGRISTEKDVEKIISIYNSSDSTVVFNPEIVAPNFINVRFDSLSLAPRSEGKITIQYNPIHDDNLGFNSHSIVLQSNEMIDSLKELHIMASIVEYFEPLSDLGMENAPKLNIENRVFDFGKINEGSSYEKKFVLTNNGKSDLNIRKIKSNCSCLTFTIDGMDIKPFTSVNLTLTLNTKGLRGSQIKNITLYSNDPNDPTQLITIKGNVNID